MTRYFTEDHEWIEVDGDSATVGITHYAQSQLGDIVFAEVPAAGATLKKGGDAAIVDIGAAGQGDRLAHLRQRLEHGEVPEQELQQHRHVADDLDIGAHQLGDEPVS